MPALLLQTKQSVIEELQVGQVRPSVAKYLDDTHNEQIILKPLSEQELSHPVILLGQVTQDRASFDTNLEFPQVLHVTDPLNEQEVQSVINELHTTQLEPLRLGTSPPEHEVHT